MSRSKTRGERSPILPVLIMTVTLLGGAQMMIVEPIVASASEAESSLTDAGQRIAASGDPQAAAKRADLLLGIAHDRIEEIEARSRRGSDPLEVHETVVRTARRARVIVNRMEHVAERHHEHESAEISENRYVLEAVGPFSQLASFVDAISAAPWLLRIDQLALNPDRMKEDRAVLALELVVIVVDHDPDSKRSRSERGRR